MLARIVALLRERGVDDIVVNCHYLHEQVETWCRDNGCRSSHEPEILGTGGVLNPLREWIGNDEFYLVNGDIVVENVPDLRLDGDEIAVALVTEEGPRTIEVEPESGFVTCWKSPDPGWSGTFTYCGFTLLKPEILDFVPPTGFSSIVEAYEKAMMKGRFVRAESAADLLWTDAGTIQNYIDLNRDGDDNAFADLPQLKAVGATSAEFLGARGSDRVFFRTHDGIAILHDDSKRAENALYAEQARWLKAKGAPVPDVIRDCPDVATTVLSWGGSEKKMTLEDYVSVVEALVKFNQLAGDPDFSQLRTMPAFDAETYAWERDLFAEHCLGTRYHRVLPKPVEKELSNVASILLKEPLALVHRDFQSTNVLWKNAQPCFIDFQGMRPGAAAYDLASLVYDPYVTLTEGERRALVALYAKKAARPELIRILPYAAVQRLVQCLGAYGRLASVGQPQFGKHVLPALQNLLDAADKAGLDAVGALAEDLIAEETRRHEHHHETGHHCSCGHPHAHP